MGFQITNSTAYTHYKKKGFYEGKFVKKIKPLFSEGTTKEKLV